MSAVKCLELLPLPPRALGEVFFAFSLNTELASGELGKDFVHLNSETWMLAASPGGCALFQEGPALGACKGSLVTEFCIKGAFQRAEPSECGAHAGCRCWKPAENGPAQLLRARTAAAFGCDSLLSLELLSPAVH